MLMIKSKYNSNLQFDITSPSGELIKSVIIEGEKNVLGFPVAGKTLVSEEDWNRIKELYKNSPLLDDDYIIAVKPGDPTDDINRNGETNDGTDVEKYIKEELKKINEEHALELKTKEEEWEKEKQDLLDKIESLSQSTNGDSETNGGTDDETADEGVESGEKKKPGRPPKNPDGAEN